MNHLKITEIELWAYVSKSADQPTIQKVEKWRVSTDFDDALFTKITTIYEQTAEPEVAVEQAKKHFFKRVESRKVVWKELLKYAAVFAVVAAGTYFYTRMSSSKDQIIVATTFGEHKTIELSDGSRVWLNASSTVSYDSETPRTLLLVGEAFFEVAKDSLRPFTVTTPEHITVKALGTSFNVKAYENGTTTETKLLSGKVEVSATEYGDTTILMQPNDKVVFYRGSKEIVKAIMNASASRIAWKEGKIQFKNKAFKAIATDLKAQFDINIDFKNETIANSKFSGSFDNTTPIAEILEILNISKNFTYELNTKTNVWIIK